MELIIVAAILGTLTAFSVIGWFLPADSDVDDFVHVHHGEIHHSPFGDVCEQCRDAVNHK